MDPTLSRREVLIGTAAGGLLLAAGGISGCSWAGRAALKMAPYAAGLLLDVGGQVIGKQVNDLIDGDPDGRLRHTVTTMETAGYTNWTPLEPQTSVKQKTCFYAEQEDDELNGCLGMVSGNPDVPGFCLDGPSLFGVASMATKLRDDNPQMTTLQVERLLIPADRPTGVDLAGWTDGNGFIQYPTLDGLVNITYETSDGESKVEIRVSNTDGQVTPAEFTAGL